jgi:hypothetical protein
MGVQEIRTACRSPWQNAYAERVIGSIRRECLDYVIVVNEAGLSRVLNRYLAYCTNHGLISRWRKTRPIPDRSHRQRSAQSSPFHRSAASTIATTAARRSHPPDLPRRRIGRRSPQPSQPNPHLSRSGRVSARHSYAPKLTFDRNTAPGYRLVKSAARMESSVRTTSDVVRFSTSRSSRLPRRVSSARAVLFADTSAHLCYSCGDRLTVAGEGRNQQAVAWLVHAAF